MSDAARYLAAAHDMLGKARDALEATRLPLAKSSADYLLDTIRANLDNNQLSDADFRTFIRNSLAAVPANQGEKRGSVRS